MTSTAAPALHAIHGARTLAAAGTLLVLALTASTGSQAADPNAGPITSGAVVQRQLDAAIAAGAATFRLPDGGIVCSSDFVVLGARDMVISGGTDTTFWFVAIPRAGINQMLHPQSLTVTAVFYQ